MNFTQEFLRAFYPGSIGFLFMWVLGGLALFVLLLIAERWWDIGRRTDVDAQDFTQKILTFIGDKRFKEAYQLCASGGRRALPRVMGSGIERAINTPALVKSAMEEETLHMVPVLEKRLPVIASCGSLATLLGLMGTIYGLILSFAAVGQPDVPPAEKASMLATGISAAMNTTLMGLAIAIPCVLLYSILRARVDRAINDIDRYAVAVLKVLLPADTTQKNYKVSGRRVRAEVDAEPNIVPFMNLMVVLIPLLLSSSEFIKLGMIELKLPEVSGAPGESGAAGAQEETKLNLGIAITAGGFDLYHYFKTQQEERRRGSGPDTEGDGTAQIPLIRGHYDYETLQREVTEVKRRALASILRARDPSIPENTDIYRLQAAYGRIDAGGDRLFADHEDLKIVAQDSIKYQVVVSVMDAARGYRGAQGSVSLFPNVSIAGGIAY